MALVQAKVFEACDVHGAGAANAFTAGAAECQGGVDLVFDLDQRVQNHWTAAFEVDRIDIDPRIAALFRVVAVDAEFLAAFGLLAVCLFGAGPFLALFGFASSGQGELNHSARNP